MSSTPVSPAAVAKAVRAATTALVLAGSFVALLLLLHAVRADLEPAWHMVSEYSVGPWGWLMQAAFLALAGSFFALLFALRPHLRGALGITGLVFLGMAGVGATMGGLFNTDPPGTAPEHISTTGMLHGFAFLLGVPGVLVAVTLLTIQLCRTASWRSQRTLLIGTAALIWLTMLIFAEAMVRAMQSGATGSSFLVGWQNRALVLAWAIWVGSLASRARLIIKQAQPGKAAESQLSEYGYGSRRQTER
jgi:hypothetical protein